MAERSKAPDSREILPLEQRLSVLVLSEGVGSNPTSDKYFLDSQPFSRFLTNFYFELWYTVIIFVQKPTRKIRHANLWKWHVCVWNSHACVSFFKYIFAKAQHARVWFQHAGCDFHTHECDFDTLECYFECYSFQL
jgi:hypothetical protein